MNGATVRAAVATDLPHVVRLLAEFRSFLGVDAPSDAQFAARLRQQWRAPDSLFLVVDGSAGALAGYVQLRLRNSVWHGREAEIEDLYVAQAARGAGLGRALLSGAVAAAEHQGCAHLYLTTNENNHVALALYEANGLDARRSRWQGGRQLWLDRVLQPRAGKGISA